MTGSWYRSLTGLLKRAADSEAAAEARRAVELQVLDRFQAGIDGVTSDAVAKLITALDQTSGAVIQVGSVLLVKAEGYDHRTAAHLSRDDPLAAQPRSLQGSGGSAQRTPARCPVRAYIHCGELTI